METRTTDWGRRFDPDRLASLELGMWKAYYRRQPARLFTLLIRANHEQARISWPRSILAAFYLARAAVRFGRSTDDYDRFAPDVVRGYRQLGFSSTSSYVRRFWVNVARPTPHVETAISRGKEARDGKQGIQSVPVPPPTTGAPVPLLGEVD